MQLAPEICERARRARDRRFDGRFFVAVRTTGIYCRPICPAPTAKAANVCYFPTAAAAHQQGFRPCRRCRPEAAPGSPAWRGTGATVSRALRMIEDGALDQGPVEDLAARLGVGERHLRRLFLQHLGAGPLAVAQTRRVHLAKSLLDQTDLPMGAIALAAGFGSVRQFNATIRATYGQPPTAVRAARRHAPPRTLPSGSYALRLAYREPFDWDGLLGYLAPRAIPGVELVADRTYRRGFLVDDALGTVAVTPAADSPALIARIATTDPRVLPRLAERLRRQFDLQADPREITGHLRGDPLLRPLCRRATGLRLPGAFDGFELTVRAILGQQVTVRAATTLAGRLVRRCRPAPPAPALHAFPSPAVVAATDLGGLGMTTARATAIQALATAVRDGQLVLDGTADPTATRRRLLDLPGVGEWTADYVALRVLGDPDALPAGDLGLRRALGSGQPVSAAELRDRSAAWRPWRAYAAVLLWRTL